MGRSAKAADIARAADVSSATATYWLKDVNGISASKARPLAEYLEVDAVWLETGEGQPIAAMPAAMGGKPPKFQPTPKADAEKRLAPREQPYIRSFDDDDDVPDDVVLVPESQISFSAGDGQIAYELIEDEEPATYRRSWFQKYGINPDRVRRFRVSGDSMEPMLFARDTILVNQDETQVIDGRLYALRYGDQLRVKYLSRRLDGTLVLRSVNPAYRDEEVPAELVNEHITIIGRVRDRSGTGGL